MVKAGSGIESPVDMAFNDIFEGILNEPNPRSNLHETN